MDVNDNGAGGNVTMGASSDVSGLLGTIESALANISSTLKDIGTSFASIQKGLKGGAPAVGGGNTGESTPAMETPGAGGGMGGAAMGMAGAAMGAGFSADKAISGVMSLYKDVVPTTATALTFGQLNYQYGIYNGNGRPLIEDNGVHPAGVAADLLRVNPTGSSSETGYAAMLTGLSKLGAMSNDDVTSRSNPASGFADLYKVAGVSNEQVPSLVQQSLSPQSEIMMMALGYQSPVNPDGTARTPFSIANEVLNRATGGKGGFANEDIMKQENRPGGRLYANFEATGQPMEYAEWMNFIQEAKTKYEEAGSAEGSWATLGESQREKITKDLTGMDDPNVNPQAAESTTTSAKALQDIGLTTEVISGWKAANDRLQQYLGYLSNLPFLEQIAKASGYNSVTSTTEGGLGAILAIPFLGPALGWTLEQAGIGEEGGVIQPSQATGIAAPGTENIGSNAEGDWNVSGDQVSKIHRGEMILPSRIATLVRHDLAGGGRPPQNTPSEVASRATEAPPGDFGGSGNSPAPQVTINVSVAQASEEEAVRLAQRVQSILTQENYLTAVAKGHGY